MINKMSACCAALYTNRQKLNSGRMGIEPILLRLSSWYIPQEDSIPSSHREPPSSASALLERFYHRLPPSPELIFTHAHFKINPPVVFATTCRPTGAALVPELRLELRRLSDVSRVF